MGQPVVHFEISAPERYGFLDVIISEDGTGYGSHAVIYVGVADIEVELERSEKLGGTRVMGPATSPNGLVVGHFTDPEGTLAVVAGVT